MKVYGGLKSIMEKFAGKDYFASVVKAMENVGFKFISQVGIDTNDFTYHVKAESARVTTLVFKARMKQFFVQMAFYEAVYLGYEDGQPELQQYWSITFHFEFKEYKEILDLLIKKNPDGDFLFDDERMERVKREIPMFQHTQNDLLDNFSCFGTRFEQTAKINVEDPKLLSKKIFSVWKKMRDYIGDKYGRIGRYQVTDFPPHYVFKGCEELFWERFGEENLLKLVAKPWGSDFPKTFRNNEQKSYAAR